MKCNIFVVGDICITLIVFSCINGGKTDGPVIAVKRVVKNVGFHRELETTFEADNLPEYFIYCVWAMKESIPSGIYVDPDQLIDLERSNLTQHKMRVIGAVNVETPQHNSSPHELMIFFNETFLQSKKIVVNVPFHLRYHKAKSGGGYTVVKIKKPCLLAMCNENLPQYESIEVPCFQNSSKECVWSVIPFKENNEAIVIEVPVGNLDHDIIVSVITILVIITGCLTIVNPFIR